MEVEQSPGEKEASNILYPSLGQKNWQMKNLGPLTENLLPSLVFVSFL
jgi:hypothetical protein